MRSLRRLAVAAALVASVGCDQMPDPGATPASAPSGAASARAAPGSGDVEAAAKAYLDAARKYAETCHCTSDPMEGIIRDVCDVKGAVFDATVAARAAVDASLRAEAPIDPSAGAFLREAQLHAAWLVESRAYLESTPIKISEDTKLIRGGVYAYQRLARLWNAWHPKEPISGIAYRSYWPGGVSSAEHPLWVVYTPVEAPPDAPREMDPSVKGKPRYLPWIECIDGPCLNGY